MRFLIFLLLYLILGTLTNAQDEHDAENAKKEFFKNLDSAIFVCLLEHDKQNSRMIKVFKGVKDDFEFLNMDENSKRFKVNLRDKNIRKNDEKYTSVKIFFPGLGNMKSYEVHDDAYIIISFQPFHTITLRELALHFK